MLVLAVCRDSSHENSCDNSFQKKAQQALAVRVLDRLVAGADEDAFEISKRGVNARSDGGDGAVKRLGSIASVRILARSRPLWTLRNATIVRGA